MASPDENIEQFIETDNASLIYSYTQETCQSERYIAGPKKEYCIRNPPQTPYTNPELSSSSCTSGIDYFQCSQNQNEMGSGSDSAEEEDSPYGSPSNKKFEMIAPSGNPSSVTSRRERYPNFSNTVEEPKEQRVLVFENGNLGQQLSGPYAKEKACSRGVLEALALSGSRTEKTASIKKSDNYALPRGEMDHAFDSDRYFNNKGTGLANSSKTCNGFEDINMRLTTFFTKRVEWPHVTPSAEVMAEAGFIFKGEFHENGKIYYDMVECYKCKGTLYGFTEDDDPVNEHGKFYPSCG